MSKPDEIPTADEVLFGGDMQLENYYIKRTPFGDLVCFINQNGEDFILGISHPELKDAVVARLLELGAPVVEKQYRSLNVPRG